MENSTTQTKKRDCKTCAYVRLGGSGYYRGSGATCGHFNGPKADKLVTIASTTCKEHRTALERAAEKIVYTSVDEAKMNIKEASIEVATLALQLETSKQNRTTLVKLLNSRLAKLARSN